MYYITEKNSETGKKFQVFSDKNKAIFREEKALADKYNYNEWILSGFTIRGNIAYVRFKDESQVDMSVWKKDGQNYSPRLNTKKGKQIKADFQNLEILLWEDLNACIGWDSFGTCIGFNENDNYFGFSVREEWEVPIPNDCKEITHTEWKKIFNN